MSRDTLSPWHDKTPKPYMEQENGGEDKIINMPFFPKSFDRFTMQSKVQKYALDSRTRTRTSTRFDCPFLAKILRLILLFVSSTGRSVILVAGN